LWLTLQAPRARAAAERGFKERGFWYYISFPGHALPGYSLHLQLGQALLDLGLTGRVLRQKTGQPHVEVLHRELQLLNAALDAIVNPLGIWKWYQISFIYYIPILGSQNILLREK